MTLELADGSSAEDVLAALREEAARLRVEGAESVRVAIDLPGDEAVAVLRRLGFVEARRELTADLAFLEERLGGETAPNVGSIHVQIDDQDAVARAVARFVPRSFVSTGSVVSAPGNGWIAVYDDAAGREPRLLRLLASELSNATGGVVIALSLEQGAVVRLIAFDRGRMTDEYLSVPEYYGPLPPGDAIALRANPTLLARLTSAPAGEIRAVARTAESPAELPPAEELLDQLAEVLGIAGPALEVEEAARLPGVAVVEHR
jgi:hypothetical protein